MRNCLVTASGIESPDDINRYTQVGNDVVTTGAEHQIGAYQTNSYSYVSDTFLAKMVGGTGGTNTYLLYYDALGRCVKRTLNNSTTYYIYDGDKAIVETGATSATNVYGIGIDEILLRTVGSANYYFYQDHEGSITHVTNGATLVEQYRYDVFGAPTIADGNGIFLNPSTTSAIGNRFMFTGREYAATFGIYEYRNRAYHPGLGRFMSEDPKGFVRRAALGKEADKWSFDKFPSDGELNLFRYCDNDPEDFTDSMGFEPIGVSEDLDGLSRIGMWRMKAIADGAKDGMERATSTGIDKGEPFLSNEVNKGHGIPYGKQGVEIPAPRPGSGIDPATGVHAHRNNIQTDGKDNPLPPGKVGPISSVKDRAWADSQHATIYTISRDGTIQERYRPDTGHIPGVTERYNEETKKWENINKLPPPKTFNPPSH